MQVYWFMFIVALIVRVMLGGQVEDIREDTEKTDKEEDSDKNPPAPAGGKESDGAGKTAGDTPKTRKRKVKRDTN